jgi:hypothetical protein
MEWNRIGPASPQVRPPKRVPTFRPRTYYRLELRVARTGWTVTAFRETTLDSKVTRVVSGRPASARVNAIARTGPPEHTGGPPGRSDRRGALPSTPLRDSQRGGRRNRPGQSQRHCALRSDRPKHRRAPLRASVSSDRSARAFIPVPTIRTLGRGSQGTADLWVRLGFVRAKPRTDARPASVRRNRPGAGAPGPARTPAASRHAALAMTTTSSRTSR